MKGWLRSRGSQSAPLAAHRITQETGNSATFLMEHYLNNFLIDRRKSER